VCSSDLTPFRIFRTTISNRNGTGNRGGILSIA